MICFTSCNNNKVYDRFKKLSPGIDWMRSKKIQFQPSISDTAIPYDIFFTVRHHTGYPHGILKVNVERISPSGKKMNKKYTLSLRDNNGRFKSEGAGDYWDYQELVEDDYYFTESGKYSYIIQHAMKKDRLTHLFDFGMVIKKDPGEK